MTNNDTTVTVFEYKDGTYRCAPWHDFGAIRKLMNKGGNEIGDMTYGEAKLRYPGIRITRVLSFGVDKRTDI